MDLFFRLCGGDLFTEWYFPAQHFRGIAHGLQAMTGRFALRQLYERAFAHGRVFGNASCLIPFKASIKENRGGTGKARPRYKRCYGATVTVLMVV